MRLFFIASGEGYCGENGDLFVWACWKNQAVEMWRDHYDLAAYEEPDHVFDITGATVEPPHRQVVSWDGPFVIRA